MTKNELVSVIIPVYNRANTIVRAINSVINQTYDDIEIIIIDDGSSDNIKNVIVMMFHSMEIMINKTPFVRNKWMQKRFLRNIKKIIEYYQRIC